jgi:hypothetical protein
MNKLAKHRPGRATYAEANLTSIARTVREDILRHETYAEVLCPGISKTILESLKQLSDVRFRRIASGAAFKLNPVTRVMTLDLSRLTELLRIAHARNDSLLEADRIEPNQIDRMAVALFLLHEVVHISQAIPEYSDVQTLKRTAGASYLAELDLIADIESARAYAAVESIPEGLGEAAYVEWFAASIFFMISFCFPVFGFRGKRAKVSRALGLALSFLLAQAHSDNEVLALRCRPRFDWPMFPVIAADGKSILIKSLRTGGQVIAIHSVVNPTALRELLKVLDSGRADLVLAHAKRVLLPAT